MRTSTQRFGVTHFPHMKQQEHMKHYALHDSSTYGSSVFEKNAYNFRQKLIILIKTAIPTFKNFLVHRT